MKTICEVNKQGDRNREEKGHLLEWVTLKVRRMGQLHSFLVQVLGYIRQGTQRSAGSHLVLTRDLQSLKEELQGRR